MKTLTKSLLMSSALLAVMTLSACTINFPVGGGMGSPGGGMGSSGQRPADVNQSDMMFVRMMIPHHEQAVEMSDILLEKSGIDSDVRALAEDIKAAQEPEIEQMEDWLSEWGMDMGMGGGMDHGEGMMSDDDLDTLDDAEGGNAAVAYLELMIPHHEGAIEMAEDVISDGENREVRELAESIRVSQAEEITLMEQMLAER